MKTRLCEEHFGSLLLADVFIWNGSMVIVKVSSVLSFFIGIGVSVISHIVVC